MNNKVYLYLGEYKLDRLYSINELIGNKQNFFYRFKKKKEKVYAIMTEVSFLLFVPYKNDEKVKLIYFNELRYFDSYEIIGQAEDILSVQLKWKKGDTTQDNIYHFPEKKMFIRKKNIIESFKVFNNKGDESNVKEILDLINFKEELYNNNKDQTKSSQMISDLINLYQKGIELLNEKGDQRYTEYIEKLKNLINHQKIINENN